MVCMTQSGEPIFSVNKSATCTSSQSRNRHVGYELGQGRTIDEIISDMVMVAEGVKTAPVVMDLAREHGITMPIAEDVSKVVMGESSAQRAFRGLLRVSAGAESEPGWVMVGA